MMQKMRPDRFLKTRMVGKSWEILSEEGLWYKVRIFKTSRRDEVIGYIAASSFRAGVDSIPVYTDGDTGQRLTGYQKDAKMKRFADVFKRVGFTPFMYSTVEDLLQEPSFIKLAKDRRIICKARTEIPSHLKLIQNKQPINVEIWQISDYGYKYLKRKGHL